MKIYNLFNILRPFIVNLTVIKRSECEGTILLGSGTGFLSGDGYLITNFHVLKNILPFLDEDKYCLLISHSKKTEKISDNQFQIKGANCYDSKCLKSWITPFCSEEYANDYIILDTNDNASLSVRIDSEGNKPSVNLNFSKASSVYVGQEGCIMGYPFGKDNLSISKCIVSSIYEKNGIKVFQLDGIVNIGNSGGPLVDLKTGNVIGIVSRKEDGLNELFDKLKLLVDENLKLMAAVLESGAGIAVGTKEGPVDIFGQLALSFNHIKELICQIERSANVGIGYAFSVDKIKENLDFLREERGSKDYKQITECFVEDSLKK